MPSKSQKLFVGLFFFALAFDYRSENSGGDLVQAFLLALLTGSWLMSVALLSGTKLMAAPLAKGAIVLTALLLFTAFVSASINGVPSGNFLRLELRYAIIFMAAFLTYLWIRGGKPPKFIFNVVCWAIAVSLIATCFYVLGIQRVPLQEVRYRISPVSSVALLGFSIYLGSKLQTKWLTLLLMSASVIFLSATRSYALAGLVSLAWLTLLAMRHGDKLLLAKVAMAAVAIPALVVLNGDLFSMWSGRISAYSTIADPTWITRVAEYTTQWRLLTESGFSAFFGKGLGAPHFYDPGIARDIIALGIINEDSGYGAFEFGHSLWVYSAFSQGALGGWILPLIVVMALLVSLANSWRKEGPATSRLLANQLSVGMCGIFVVTFFSHPFGNRMFCVVFGAVLILIMSHRAVIRREFLETTSQIDEDTKALVASH